MLYPELIVQIYNTEVVCTVALFWIEIFNSCWSEYEWRDSTRTWWWSPKVKSGDLAIIPCMHSGSGFQGIQFWWYRLHCDKIGVSVSVLAYNNPFWFMITGFHVKSKVKKPPPKIITIFTDQFDLACPHICDYSWVVSTLPNQTEGCCYIWVDAIPAEWSNCILFLAPSCISYLWSPNQTWLLLRVAYIPHQPKLYTSYLLARKFSSLWYAFPLPSMAPLYIVDCLHIWPLPRGRIYLGWHQCILAVRSFWFGKMKNILQFPFDLICSSE